MLRNSAGAGIKKTVPCRALIQKHSQLMAAVECKSRIPDILQFRNPGRTQFFLGPKRGHVWEKGAYGHPTQEETDSLSKQNDILSLAAIQYICDHIYLWLCILCSFFECRNETEQLFVNLCYDSLSATWWEQQYEELLTL